MKKYIHLECARGIASIFVIFHHFALAFTPTLKYSIFDGGIKNTPLYTIINGSASVNFFFMLSGFVLSLNFHQKGNIENLKKSIIKRYPRLFLPVFASIIAGYILLAYGNESYLATGHITNSTWLIKYGNAMFPENFAPSISDALKKSITIFFLPNSFYYNSNLWTMRDEFLGSMLVFSIMLVGHYFKIKSKYSLLISILIFAFFFLHPSFSAFLTGMLISYFFSKNERNFKMSKKSSLYALILISALYSNEFWLSQLIGSSLMMITLLCSDDIKKYLSGATGEFLGKLSFPIYLTHTLVILSLGSSTYKWCHERGMEIGATITTTFITTAIASLLSAIIFMKLEEWWVPYLNQVTDNIFKINSNLK